MKAVILAGGLGTRLSEETQLKPKPMVEIGGRPILWHIMKIYFAHGVTDFIVCLGYRGFVIKEYFQNYALHQSDVTFDMGTGEMKIHRSDSEDWRVTLVDTGEHAMTGARIRKVLPYVEGDDAFCLTYGDGVGDVDIKALLAFHKQHGKIATLTAVTPPGRFGALRFDDKSPDMVSDFVEKPAGDGGLINGGFFVLSPKVAPYLACGDEVVWEQKPLTQLANDGQLAAFRHRGFWQPMDTIRDRTELERLWMSGAPPWKCWS
ncbi:MAG: glucose-1-phosphate cytidylyltransferase [Parvularculaceae bacterium]